MCNSWILWIVWPICSGHPIFGRVRWKEAVHPVFIRYPHPKSAMVKRTSPVHRKDSCVSQIVFPMPGWSLGRLLRTCVPEGPGHLVKIVRLRIVRHRTLPPVCMLAVYRPTVRRLLTVWLWVLSPGEPYPGRECLLGRTALWTLNIYYWLQCYSREMLSMYGVM